MKIIEHNNEVQPALDDAGVLDGWAPLIPHVVLLAPGIFTGNLTVPRGVVLESVSRGGTIIVGDVMCYGSMEGVRVLGQTTLVGNMTGYNSLRRCTFTTMGEGAPTPLLIGRDSTGSKGIFMTDVACTTYGLTAMEIRDDQPQGVPGFVEIAADECRFEVYATNTHDAMSFCVNVNTPAMIVAKFMGCNFQSQTEGVGFLHSRVANTILMHPRFVSAIPAPCVKAHPSGAKITIWQPAGDFVSDGQVIVKGGY